jgi:hypothetical protein
VTDGLSPQQVRAADLLGRNWTIKDVALEIGVSEKTLGPERWGGRADFAALVRERRAALLDQIPTAKATLEAALSATTKSGEPDWPIRVKAAQLLMTTADPGGAPDPDDERPTFVYMPPDEEDASGADAG